MRIWNILLIIVTLSLALVTCCKDLTGVIEVDESVMKVSVLKEGASFAAVRVSIDTKTAAKDFSLQLNGEEVTAGQFSGLDTLVFIDSLVPATEYALRGNYWRKGQLAGISGEEEFTTLPLSSNDFTWRVDTVGAFPAQANDLAVIDENNVWAVGKFPRFFAEDKAPNMVKWNGYDYEYHKIRIRALWSDSSWIDPLQTATAFSANDVWVFTLTGGYSRFDGTNWSTDRIPLESYKGNITKVWGFNSDDMYLIGTNGSITHYDGQNFTLMESGTDADLIDIHGFTDEKTGEKTIWIAGHYILLKLVDKSWIQVWNTDNPVVQQEYYPHRVHAIDENLVLLCAYNGPFRKNRLYLFDSNDISNSLLLSEGITFDWDMSYSALNNILLAGDFGNIEHYDGSSFPLVNDFIYANRIMSIKQTERKIFAIATLGQEAHFIHGLQN